MTKERVRVIAYGPPMTEHQQRRLQKLVDEQMSKGQGVSSQSGLSADFAVIWCQRNGYGFTLTASPFGGYYVERGEKDPRV